MLQKITDHIARAIARMIAFMRGLLPERLIAQSLGSQVQEVEDALYASYLIRRDIDQADGTNLDRLGALLGAPLRGTRTDLQYRTRIKAQILLNTYKGTQSELYAVARLLVPAWTANPTQVRYEDEQRMTYTVRSSVNTLIVSTAEAQELAREISKVGPTGTRGIVFSQPVAPTAQFNFSGGPGLGFGQGSFIGAYDK